jgi:hypothetical protein
MWEYPVSYPTVVLVLSILSLKIQVEYELEFDQHIWCRGC